MKKYTLDAILQFIAIMMLTTGIVLGWVGYAYDGMPLISAICFTILDVLLLLFQAIKYVVATTYFMERENEKEKRRLEEEE